VLFKVSFNIYTMQHQVVWGQMDDELQTIFERHRRGSFEILSGILPVGTGENHCKPRSG
jgi:hypothetical protein